MLAIQIADQSSLKDPRISAGKSIKTITTISAFPTTRVPKVQNRKTSTLTRRSVFFRAPSCIFSAHLSLPNSTFSLTVGRLGQVVLAFSALSNGRKILHCGAPPPDSLTCVHGLRFLSLAWVIMVHTYLQVFTIAGKQNFLDLQYNDVEDFKFDD